MLPEAALDSPTGVDQLQRRDAHAWQTLVELYSTPLKHDIAVSLVKRGVSDQVLEDVLQETWLVAWKQIDCFTWRQTGLLYRWLRVISLNRIRNCARRQREDPTISLEECESSIRWAWRWAQDVHAVETRISTHEDVAVLLDALQRQSSRDQEILTSWLLDEAKPRELAQRFGLKPASTSQIIWRFLKGLRARLDDGLAGG